MKNMGGSFKFANCKRLPGRVYCREGMMLPEVRHKFAFWPQGIPLRFSKKKTNLAGSSNPAVHVQPRVLGIQIFMCYIIYCMCIYIIYIYIYPCQDVLKIYVKIIITFPVYISWDCLDVHPKVYLLVFSHRNQFIQVWI